MEKWTDCAIVPILSSDKSIDVFRKIRKFNNFFNEKSDHWIARANTDVHPTNDKNMFNFAVKKPKNCWPIYSGDSFDLFEFNYEKTYAWIDKDKIISVLQEKRNNSRRRENSIFNNFDDKWFENIKTLPCFHPRIVLRDVTNRTNNRTLITSLAPPESILAGAAPYILFSGGNIEDQIY